MPPGDPPQADGKSASKEPVAAAGEEFQAAEVPEDLKLLADFVVDVGVVRMELGEDPGVGVDIRKLEFRFVQRLNHLQDVQGPAAFFDARGQGSRATRPADMQLWLFNSNCATSHSKLC